MIRATTSVTIDRLLRHVYGYVSEPRNFPAWNSAVQRVHPSGETTYVMERELPGGRATNELEVTLRDPEREFAFHTTSGPTPFGYRIEFKSSGDTTTLHVDVSTSLGPTAELLAPLARSTVKRGVEENLATLKRILESSQPNAA